MDSLMGKEKFWRVAVYGTVVGTDPLLNRVFFFC